MIFLQSCNIALQVMRILALGCLSESQTMILIDDDFVSDHECHVNIVATDEHHNEPISIKLVNTITDLAQLSQCIDSLKV